MVNRVQLMAHCGFFSAPLRLKLPWVQTGVWAVIVLGAVIATSRC